MRADVQILASGYRLAEAPRADADGGVFYTDVLGGGVYRWSDAGIDTIVPKRRGVGGLALHAEGGVVCSGRDVVHVRPDGTSRTVWTPPEYVTGINDMCALPTGAVVVGALQFSPFAGEAPVPGAFWHVDADHDCIFFDDIDWPNGCGVSPDGERIYACDYARGVVHVRDVDGKRLFATSPTGEADGLAVDGEGGVWVALPRAGSIARFTPDGELDQTLEIGGFVTSLAFDGGDWMYVTTADLEHGVDGALLRLPAPVPGPRHLLATV